MSFNPQSPVYSDRAFYPASAMTPKRNGQGETRKNHLSTSLPNKSRIPVHKVSFNPQSPVYSDRPFYPDGLHVEAHSKSPWGTINGKRIGIDIPYIMDDPEGSEDDLDDDNVAHKNVECNGVVAFDIATQTMNGHDIATQTMNGTNGHDNSHSDLTSGQVNSHSDSTPAMNGQVNSHSNPTSSRFTVSVHTV
jgi:hypothetical protein